MFTGAAWAARADSAMQPEQHYQPPPWLKNPHLHTFVNSKIRKPWLQFRSVNFESLATEFIIRLGDGTRLQAIANLQTSPAPTIVILAGLLGGYRSGYVLSSATYLCQQGYSIVRLMLKDHGRTAHLNPEVFSAADISEVKLAFEYIKRHLATGGVGVLGFSLGGNIALRLNLCTGLQSLAVCPVLDPAAAVKRIDQNWFYRKYFVNKWRRVIRQKMAAYPHDTVLSGALAHSSLTDLTRHFAVRHSHFRHLQEYFASYTLNRNQTSSGTATTVYSLDDPVIPCHEYQQLLAPQQTVCSQYGGHCAFLEKNFSRSWVDCYAAHYFKGLHS